MRYIVFYILFMATHGIDYKQYCKLPEEKCKITSHGLDCAKLGQRCEGRFRSNCDEKYCAENQNSCASIYPIVKTLKIYSLIKHKAEIKREMEKFMASLDRKFQTCPNTTYRLDSIDFCILRQNSCRHFPKLVFRFGGFHLIRSVKCQCSKNFFNCDENICTKDKATCDTFKEIKMTNSKSLSFIRECVNP